MPLVPDFQLRLNGAPCPLDAQADVASVVVEEGVDTLSTFEIQLYNWDPDRLRVSWSDSRQFAPGVEVEIALGYLDDVRPMMSGEITSLEPVFSADRPPMLTVRGYDHGHRLARGRKTHAYLQLTDTAIAQQIATRAGLRGTGIHRVSNVNEYVLQGNQTDLEFLRRLARRNGFEVFVRDRGLHFRPPPVDGAPALTVDVEELSEFSPRLNLFGQVPKSTVRGWDPQRMQTVIGSATVRQLTPMGLRTGGAQSQTLFGAVTDTVVDVPIAVQAEADALATGRIQVRTLSFVQGEAEGAGHPGLRAGVVVEITGAGTTFSGRYYIPSVTHSITPDQGYRTSFDVRRNAS